MSKKIKSMVYGLIAILVVAASIYIIYTRDDTKSAGISVEVKKSIPVDTIMPDIGDIVVTSEYIGVVEPSRQVSVYPKVSGEVLSVHFSVGDKVEVGDVLFVINATDIQNNIQSIKAQIATNAEQAFFAMQQRELTLNQAMIALETLTKSFEDTSALYEAGAIPRSTFEQAETACSNAEIAVNQARSAFEQARSGYNQAIESQRAANGQLYEQQSENVMIVNLQIAEARLNDATVKAPISGVVEKRGIDPLSMVSPQTSAFVISDKGSMNVSYKIPKNSYTHVKTGDRIVLKDGDADYAGVITEISTMVDASGLFTVKASVPIPSASLYTGTSIKIMADAQKAQNVLLIPLHTVYYDNGRPFVYVAEDGFAKKVQVETGIFDAQYIQIIAGITSTDRIISTWSSRLAENAAITLISEVVLGSAGTGGGSILPNGAGDGK
ncbi:MAG: efflux RND transporter periplasmic adaptor subunit [Peptococcaceae bacterium]|nr:efflux RND transporter periplasmic adaptor subunit [Peptococcaceae bacterium]